MLSLEDKKLIFVGGKGGVGKSSTSSAIALHLSENCAMLGNNQKILLYSTDPAHSLSDSFNIKIGNALTSITNTLDVIEINADQLLNEFKAQHRDAIHTVLARGLHINHDDTNQALSLAIPGIDEFMGLMKLSSFIDNEIYKTIVVDTAPTGHTIRLLSMPSVVNSWAMFFSGLHNKYKKVMWTLTGNRNQDEVDTFIDALSQGVYKVYRMITDNNKTEFIIVTIPDLMAIEETKRLILSLYSTGIKVNNMVVNNIQANTDCAFCRSRRNYQEKYINEINSLYPEINKIYMPLFPTDINSMTYLTAFKDLLFNS